MTTTATPTATPATALPGLALRILLAPVDRFLDLAGHSYRLFLALVTWCPPALLDRLGRLRAARAADTARRRVPAYRDFLAQGRTVMDKANYVRAYPIPERCLDGVLPTSGVAIDESSGSTGVPHNWVRSIGERKASHAFISHFARHCYGDEPSITINAFSMGAWATGINMGIAMQRTSVVKSTGPDVDKILSTLEVFGTGRRYLICGYPPFLKHLLDEAAARNFPLGAYRLAGLVGGEGMSEGLRDYLSTAFEPVFSGYGATDLEIGIAGETPVSVAVRRAARRDPELRRALFGDDPRLPMLFQYNPASHQIEVTGDGELVFTICREGVLSPRVAYNLHDAGGVATFAGLAERAAAAGTDIGALAAGSLRLPFLWVYGRSDSTVSVMGANIYPEDLEQALYRDPSLAAVTSGFCLGLEEDADGAVRPAFSFELRVEPTPELTAIFTESVTAGIEAVNLDYRTALAEHRASAAPVVRLFAAGTGPFAGDSRRIKQTRMLAGTPR
jgi:phenylacetate-CoA ligase